MSSAVEDDGSNDGAPDLRLILVGSQRFGVNSVASSILGGEGIKAKKWGRRTARSVTHTGIVNGKKIQLVKAPAWLRSYHLCDTAQLVKEELVLSLTYCRPGPHAFILLVEVDVPFTSACANAFKKHLSLFGDIWSHTIIVFTCGDWLGNKSIKEYIEGEGAHLAELLQRCGHRYEVDCTSASTALSVRVLEKVQVLLKTNGDRHFEINQSEIQRIFQNREEVNRRVEERRQRRKERKTQEKRNDTSMSEITIVLLGWVFAVKTSVCCALLGIPEQVGRTLQSTKTSTDLNNQLTLTVVDTPGWWKYFSASLVPCHAQAQINQAFKEYQEAVVSTSSGRAVLLMIPADTSFQKEQLKIIKDNMKPLGEKIWSNIILVFTRGHWLGQFDIEHHIESEGKALVWLVEQCGNRYFVFDGDAEQSGLEAQGKQLIEMVLDMCQSPPNEGQSAHTDPVLEEEPTEEPVDPDLRKMVNVLHKVWAWGSWEIEEFAARFFERPMYEFTDIASMHLTNLLKGSSDRCLIKQPREEVEKILREEMQGKSLEELVEIALQVYFRREVGAFDIVSMICEKDQFKPEWKALFEREWARREVRLMEHVFIRYIKAGSDDARRMLESYNRVSAWLDSMPPSIEELVKMIIHKLDSLINPVKQKTEVFRTNSGGQPMC